jgi:hypothetical protein
MGYIGLYLGTLALCATLNSLQFRDRINKKMLSTKDYSLPSPVHRIPGLYLLAVETMSGGVKESSGNKDG